MLSVTRRLAVLLILTSVSSPVAFCVERLNVLAAGQVMPGESPIPLWFDADPLVDYVLIPTDIDIMGGRGVAGEHVMEDTWRRFVRIYFPKTREALVEGFEFFVFPDGYLDPFTTSQVAHIRYAIENGLGSFVTMGGDLSAPDKKSYPGWESSTLYELLPAELNDKMKQDGSSFRVQVLKNDPPLLSMFVPLGIEKVRGSGGFTYLYSKPGTTIWAKLISDGLPSGVPDDWLISWKVGATGGFFWVVADDLDHSWWSSVHVPSQNEYSMDVFLNILLYSTGRPLPDDILVVHDLRDRYWHYNQERVMLFSLLEFVDRFGANTRSLEHEIDEVDQLKEKSFDEYRVQDFEGALASIQQAMSKIATTANNAIRLKDRALLWVYVTEWCAVTGTLFTSGFFVYTLLIRRRLYKEVAVTRAR